MLGFPILYFKGMRPMMFRLSGFYCRLIPAEVPSNPFIPPAGYAATICGLPAKPLTQARGFATVVYNRGRNNQYGMISHRFMHTTIIELGPERPSRTIPVMVLGDLIP